MVTLVTVGTLLISTGPALAFLFFLLLRRAHLFVISIFSAFIWCVSVIIASVIWVAIPPLKQTYGWNIFVVVTSQEAFRYGLFVLVRIVSKTANGVQIFVRPGAVNECLTGVAVGAGFALMSPLIHFFSVLANDYSDDTAIYTDECPFNFFVAASAFALAFSLLHIMLGVIVWPAYSAPDGRFYILICYLVHLTLGEITLGNTNINGCVWSLPVIYILSSILFILTIYVANKRIKGVQ